MSENPSSLGLAELLDELPPVCEFADEETLVWHDPSDQACDGGATWLLVGPGGLPSPLCEKHASILRQRLAPLSEYDMRLIRG